MNRGKVQLLKRKKVIVFAYEGKNNKTESQYFSHFSPTNNDYIIKTFPSGVTDPRNMLSTVKRKRNRFDYHANEDLTFIFVDGDCNEKKLALIKEIQKKLPKDIRIVVSNPCFEVWFLNHFMETTKEFANNAELIKELERFLFPYDKNKDYYSKLEQHIKIAIKNSNLQKASDSSSFTDVVYLFDNKIVK